MITINDIKKVLELAVPHTNGTGWLNPGEVTTRFLTYPQTTAIVGSLLSDRVTTRYNYTADGIELEHGTVLNRAGLRSEYSAYLGCTRFSIDYTDSWLSRLLPPVESLDFGRIDCTDLANRIFGRIDHKLVNRLQKHLPTIMIECLREDAVSARVFWQEHFLPGPCQLAIKVDDLTLCVSLDDSNISDFITQHPLMTETKKRVNIPEYGKHIGSEIRISTPMNDGIELSNYNQRPQVLSYHTPINWPFYRHQSENRSTRYIGIELELSASYSSMEKVANIVKETIPYRFCMQSDGSICGPKNTAYDSGAELILAPHSEEAIKEIPLKRLLGRLRQVSGSYSAKTCGLHVHLSRTGIRNEIKTMKNLINLTSYGSSFFKAFSRRKDYTYCQIHSPGSREWLNNRHSAINFTNRRTVEFRLWRGTLNYKAVKASIQMSLAMLDYAQVASTASTRQAKALPYFIDWIYSQPKYQFLSDYIKNDPKLRELVRHAKEHLAWSKRVAPNLSGSFVAYIKARNSRPELDPSSYANAQLRYTNIDRPNHAAMMIGLSGI